MSIVLVSDDLVLQWIRAFAEEYNRADDIINCLWAMASRGDLPLSLRHTCDDIVGSIEEGSTLSNCLQQYGLFGEVYSDSLACAVDTKTLDETIEWIEKGLIYSQKYQKTHIKCLSIGE